MKIAVSGNVELSYDSEQGWKTQCLLSALTTVEPANYNLEIRLTL